MMLLTVVLLLAFANGANDNFKGVATLHGAGLASRRKILAWATLTTFAGCVVAAWLAMTLASRFSGREILSPSLLSPEVATALSGAAALVVLSATVLGLPISTTHALLGGLIGASVALQGWAIPWLPLALFFALPLATSPLVSALLAWLSVKAVRSEPACLCVGPVAVTSPPSIGAPAALSIDAESACEAREAAKIVSGRSFETSLHFLSAGAVSFARGLNDVPKIAGILLVAPPLAPDGLLLGGLGLAMAVGGLVGSGRIARTMSCEITPMSDRQGLLSNLVTSSLVIGAGVAGLPVSTTHVSCGSLGGLGLATGKLARARFLQILLSWAVTLPAAAALSWATVRILG